MPGIHIDLTEDQYARIPGKKRTWVRNLILNNLPAREMILPASDVEVPTRRQYAFMTDNGVITGEGYTPAEAARSIGLGLTVSWKTMEEAKAAGWFDNIMMKQ